MAKRTLIIKTIKIPIDRAKDGTITERNIEVTKDMVIKEEERELDSSVFVKLPEITQEISNFNKRQIKFAEVSKTKDYIKKKIITK